MSKFNVAEAGHVVSVYPPASGTGTCEVLSMAGHSHCSFIITQGVAASAHTVQLYRADDFAPSNSTAIYFSYYQEATSGGDTLGARGSANSVSMTSGSNQILVLEVDSDQLITSSPNLYLDLGTGTQSNISAVAILSGARFGSEESPSVTS